jgi:hypothetical protein
MKWYPEGDIPYRLLSGFPLNFPPPSNEPKGARPRLLTTLQNILKFVPLLGRNERPFPIFKSINQPKKEKPPNQPKTDPDGFICQMKKLPSSFPYLKFNSQQIQIE